MKYCTGCNISKTLSEFNKNRSTRDGLQYYCKPCQRAISLRWNKANPEKKKAATLRWDKANPEKKRESMLKCKFNMSLEQFNQMLIEQNNVCAICNRPESQRTGGTTISALAVDHCHTTGKVRGLLCAACNVSLGRFNEDIETLKRAIEYLESSKNET